MVDLSNDSHPQKYDEVCLKIPCHLSTSRSLWLYNGVLFSLGPHSSPGSHGSWKDREPVDPDDPW